MAKNLDKEYINLIRFCSSFPKIKCSICRQGFLSIDIKQISKKATPASKEALEHEASDPIWLEDIWTGMAYCTNPDCVHPFAISGTTEYIEEFDTYHNEINYVTHYIIKTTYPEMMIFVIPDSCSEKVSQEIKKSFALFFNNLSGCANALRTAIEYLLTDLKIRKCSIANHKKRRLTLHNRIEELGKKNCLYSDSSKQLMAIKWIGNEGSHSEVSETEILKAYKILAHVLDDLQVKINRREIEKEANSVIRKHKR